MAAFVLGEMARVVSGTLIQGDGEAVLDRYSIDSRTVRGGEMFFALRGPNHDGHDFLADAFAKGAAAAMVSREDIDAPDGHGLIRVDDTTAALQELANAYRRRAGLEMVVGITGSTGKTTTKEMTAAALGIEWKTYRSPGNLNNAYGLPLALLGMPEGMQAAVLEMGMSTPGEITRLVRIADPDLGVILNVSDVHRANFASVDEIARAKGELFGAMRKGTTAVYNAADPRVRALGMSFLGNRVSFAVDEPADLVVSSIEDDMIEGVRFIFRHPGVDGHPIKLRCYGRHNAGNAAAALAVVFSLGLDTIRAAEAIEAVEPPRGRGVVERLGGDTVLVDETYNSNPAAVGSVLESLAATTRAGRRVAVLGDMLELGDAAAALHRQMGGRAAAAGVDLLVAVGPLARETAAGAREAGFEATGIFADSSGAAQAADRIVRPGDLVLVKGSRGIAMERFADAVRALCPAGGERVGA